MNGTKLDSKVVQITNICPNINADQMKTFLSFVGRLDQFKLYPERINLLTTGNVTTKVAYAKFARAEDAAVALHLTNTVFIDRALILVPVDSGIIPDEAEGMKNAVVGVPGSHNKGNDASNGQYDDSLQFEPDTYEELSRTVYVENIPTEAFRQPELLITYFGQIGEVKYIRLAGDPSQRAAFIEFSQQESADLALQQTGVTWNESELRINKSQTLIAKSQLKSNSAAQKEIELAMEQVREAETLIKAHAAAPLEPPLLPGSINKSAMKARSRSREASRGARRRTPSPRRRRSRTRSRGRDSKSRRSRSRSKGRRPSRSPKRKRERSRSGSRRSKDREREKEREKREREKEREKEKERKASRRDKERNSSEERDRKASKKDKDKYSSDEDRTSHKKKHKKDKKRKHRDSSRSRSRDRTSKKNGEFKEKERKSVSPDHESAFVSSPSVANVKLEEIDASS